MKELVIFGYGALMSPASITATAPSAHIIGPAYIKGFKREFCFWDAIGFTETNLDVAGQPMCAVDVHKVDDPAAQVNGVAFTVSGVDLKRLILREKGYALIETQFYDFETGQEMGLCQVFSANKHDGEYAFDNAAQIRYLQICSDGAKQCGERFYQEFLETTFIDNQRLSELSQLVSL
jgi:cation transport regulator ChaC